MSRDRETRSLGVHGRQLLHQADLRQGCFELRLPDAAVPAVERRVCGRSVATRYATAWSCFSESRARFSDFWLRFSAFKARISSLVLVCATRS
jgi:hypothetical protein